MPKKISPFPPTRDEISRFLELMDSHYPLEYDLTDGLNAMENQTITRVCNLIKIPYVHGFKGGKDNFTKLEEDMIALKAYDYYMPIVMQWYNGLARQRKKLYDLIEGSP